MTCTRTHDEVSQPEDFASPYALCCHDECHACRLQAATSCAGAALTIRKTVRTSMHTALGSASSWMTRKMPSMMGASTPSFFARLCADLQAKWFKPIITVNRFHGCPSVGTSAPSFLAKVYASRMGCSADRWQITTSREQCQLNWHPHEESNR